MNEFESQAGSFLLGQWEKIYDNGNHFLAVRKGSSPSPSFSQEEFVGDDLKKVPTQRTRTGNDQNEHQGSKQRQDHIRRNHSHREMGAGEVTHVLPGPGKATAEMDDEGEPLHSEVFSVTDMPGRSGWYPNCREHEMHEEENRHGSLLVTMGGNLHDSLLSSHSLEHPAEKVEKKKKMIALMGRTALQLKRSMVKITREGWCSHCKDYTDQWKREADVSFICTSCEEFVLKVKDSLLRPQPPSHREEELKEKMINLMEKSSRHLEDSMTDTARVEWCSHCKSFTEQGKDESDLSFVCHCCNEPVPSVSGMLPGPAQLPPEESGEDDEIFGEYLKLKQRKKLDVRVNGTVDTDDEDDDDVEPGELIDEMKEIVGMIANEIKNLGKPVESEAEGSDSLEEDKDKTKEHEDLKIQPKTKNDEVVIIEDDLVDVGTPTDVSQERPSPSPRIEALQEEMGVERMDLLTSESLLELHKALRHQASGPKDDPEPGNVAGAEPIPVKKPPQPVKRPPSRSSTKSASSSRKGRTSKNSRTTKKTPSSKNGRTTKRRVQTKKLPFKERVQLEQVKKEVKAKAQPFKERVRKELGKNRGQIKKIPFKERVRMEQEKQQAFQQSFQSPVMAFPASPNMGTSEMILSQINSFHQGPGF